MKMRYAIAVLFAILVVGVVVADGGGISSCTELSTPDNYYLSGPINASGSCIYIVADNITLDCQNNAITGDGTGVGIDVNGGSNVTVKNCDVQNFSEGIDYYNTLNDTLSDSKISDASTGGSVGLFLSPSSGFVNVSDTSVTMNDAYAVLDESSNDTLTDVNASSESSYGAYIEYSDDSVFSNLSASTSSGYYGLMVQDASNNIFTDVDASSNGVDMYVGSSSGNIFSGLNTSSADYGLYFEGSTGNAVANSTLTAISHALGIFDASNNNIFTNNTFVSLDLYSYLVFMGSSYYNTFSLNNFTNSYYYYVYDPTGQNYFSATIDGKNQGNIYSNVMDGSDGVAGTEPSSIPGLYIGTDGAVPYTYESSAYKLYDDVDYAPLTPSTDNASVCHVLDTPNQVYNLTEDVHGSGYCMDVEADNVTLDCRGHSIVGIGEDGFGVYSSYLNTTVENCNITNFEYGVYFENNANGTIQNSSLSNDYTGFYLWYSDGNSILSNRMDSDEYGFGVYYSNYNQIGLNNITNTYYYNFDSSCPFLFTWNGTGYGFVADISGQGVLGGTSSKSNPLDYTKISESQLTNDGSVYKMQLTEEYDEISYLDQVNLTTVDHSPDVDVYTTLVKANGSSLFTVGKNLSAVLSCTDGSGDCLPAVSKQDGYYTVQGVNGSNPVVLDLGPLSGATNVKLVLSGFSTWAGNPLERAIQVKDSDGNWVNVYSGSQLRLPPGFPRTFVVDLTGKFPTSDHHVRLALNGAQYDYIAVDTTPQQSITVNTYQPSSADLHFRGYSNVSTGIRQYPDYNTVSTTSNFSSPGGNFTKYGDVTPLLTAADDEYIIMHHGDEISVAFPFNPVPSGQVRDFILDSDVYFKPVSKVDGNSVDPLPFAAMSSYPYPSNESYPYDAAHLAYLSTWNTRNYTFGKPVTAGGSMPYSSDNVVFNNTISGGSNSEALYLYQETDTQLLGNQISGVYEGFDEEESSGLVNDHNNLQNIGQDAIYLYDNSGTSVTANTIMNATWGVDIESDSGDLVSGNNITKAVNGITMSDTDSDTISNNSVSTAGTIFTSFDYPNDVAYGPDGYVYVADTDNDMIQKINPATSETSIVAGQPGSSGYQEGVGPEALFERPYALTFGSDGYLYVADECLIRKINITTNQTFFVAGDNVNLDCGYGEGVGSAAYFYEPRGLAFGPDGYLYVADSDNQMIRRINVTTNETSLVAGDGSWGYAEDNTAGSNAMFEYPLGLAFGPDGYLYVADSNNHVIRKINVTTTGTYYVTGHPQSCGYQEGINESAYFCYPAGLAFGHDGYLYIADSDNYLIRKANVSTGQTYFVAGNESIRYQEGAGANAGFEYPLGLSAGAGNTIYIADTDNNRIRSINTLTNQTSLVAGNGYGGYLFDYERSAILVEGSGDNTIANNTLVSSNTVMNMFSTGSNTVVNNTLTSPSSVLLSLDPDSSGNTFYWNTFGNTNQLYVNDSNGGNYYDGTTPNGTDEGNLWYNAMHGQVALIGTEYSTGFPQYLIATGGSGYPYNDAHAVRVNGEVVPGRNHTTCLALRWAPGRRHVGIRPEVDREGRDAVGRGSPLRVGTSDVSEQPT